ncbi:porin [Pseudomonas sp. Leaf127]|uniref:OprD family porin n=1 Tax=Pseudomonas sp. Leaf127 TaxID=1736267 RepID=UPI0007027F5F|nr:OprD family porin [Pseudomonas sp. Leaf127]KQQ64981.1 porin [Pseudomonas sp. Leaf127]
MFESRFKQALAATVGLCAASTAQAGFVEDSHLTLGLRNFYVDRDFKQDNAPKSRTGSWSQGFDLQFKSGYTDTPVQFGLDVGADFAYRLDGGKGRSPDGVLPVQTDGSPVHDYGHANVAAKVRYSKTELRIGDQRPNLPVASFDPTRQLATRYEGAVLESREIQHLTLTAGRLWSITGRESANREDLYLWGDTPAQSSNGLNFAGASYAFTPTLSGTYFYAQLEDIYRQHYLGLAHKLPLGNGFTLKTDARYYNTKEEGQALSGRVDNRTYGLMFSLNKGSHTFGAGYQRMMGLDTFPTFNNYAPAPYLINWSALGFVKPGERSWQVRYDYDFAGLGLPGLKWMARWMEGNDIDLGRQSHETERTSILSYVVQSGPLKGLGANWMNIGVNVRDTSRYEENRLALTYTVNFW